MNLGERIYTFRSRNGMSQGELADKLQVSRQAVSKWENNSAVPDLDRIIKMSELFSVSIDELVKGTEIPKEKTEDIKSSVQTEEAIVVKASMPMRKIAGLLLFCMGFLTALVFFLFGGPAGVLYGIPFFILGAICFFCEKYPGLKCLWAGYFMIMMYIGLAMGIFVFDIRSTFSWTYEMNYARLILSWILVIFSVFVVTITSIRLKNEPIKKAENAKGKLILVWAAVVAAFIAAFFADYLISGFLRDYLHFEDHRFVASTVFGIFSVFEEYLYVIVFSVAVSYTLRYIKQKIQ